LIVRTNVHTFDWDDGNRAKCQKHGLSIAQIEFALTHDARVAPDAQHSGEEQRFIAIAAPKRVALSSSLSVGATGGCARSARDTCMQER